MLLIIIVLMLSCGQNHCDKFCGKWIRDDYSIAMLISASDGDKYNVKTFMVGVPGGDTLSSQWHCNNEVLEGEEGPAPLVLLYDGDKDFIELRISNYDTTRFYRGK